MTSARLKAIVPTVVLLILSGIYFVTGLGYPSGSSAVPLAVCGVTVVLLVIDLLSQGDGAVGTGLRRAFGGAEAKRPGAGTGRVPISREIAALAWIVAFTVLAVIFGFYVSIPVYVIAYLRLYARKPLLTSVIIGVVLTAVLYLLFAVLLGYEIFGGLVFGGYM